MILTCPNCSTKFNIKDGALGKTGRKVKCSKCDHSWHAMPNGEAENAAVQVRETDSFGDLDNEPPPGNQPAEALGAQPPPTDLMASGVENSDNGYIPSEGVQAKSGGDGLSSIDPSHMPPDSQVRPPTPGRPSSDIISWVVFILLLVTIIISMLFLRKDLVILYPPLNKVYEIFGFAPYTLGHGLELLQPNSEIRKEGNAVILTVKGKIENTTSSVIDVPHLKGVLFDSNGKETMTTKTFKPTEPRILPGEKTGYVTEIKNPPPGSMKITIIFAQKEEILK